MKRTIGQRFAVSIIVVLFVVANACNEDYFNPEPFPPNKNIQVSTYDYLSGVPGTFGLFVNLIDKAGYKDSVNISGATVLAVTNEGVNKYLELGKLNSIDDIDANVLGSLIGKYVFRESLTTADVGSIPEEHQSVTGYKLRFSKRKDKWKGIEGLGPVAIFVDDAKDPGSESDDVVYKIATSDIKTSSGNVLAFGVDHIFGF